MKILKLYKPIEKSDARIIDLLGGRGRGGSHFMAQHALSMLISPTYFHAYFMRGVHKDVKTSLWKGFRARFDECIEAGMITEKMFIISDREMTIKFLSNGNEIRSKGFRTSSGGQTANLKSLEGATTIYIEEAEEITEAQFMKLEDSLRTTKGKLQIFRSWNIPPKNHFLVKNYYEPIPVCLTDGNGIEHEGYYRLEPKGVPGHLMIFGTYKDNIRNLPEHKIAKWESYHKTNPEWFFTDICGYASGGAKGVIFKFEVNWFTYTELPDYDFYETYGLDFGGGGVNEKRKIYPEPLTFDEPDGSSTTVLVRLMINKASMSVYVKLLIYKAYISPDELTKYCKQYSIRQDGKYLLKKNILADSARQDKIREMINEGLNIIGAKTKEGLSNKIISGIDIMKKYKIFIHENDIPAQIEFNNFKWDINSNGELTGNVNDKFKDIADAIRYPLINYELYKW